MRVENRLIVDYSRLYHVMWLSSTWNKKENYVLMFGMLKAIIILSESIQIKIEVLDLDTQ